MLGEIRWSHVRQFLPLCGISDTARQEIAAKGWLVIAFAFRFSNLTSDASIWKSTRVQSNKISGDFMMRSNNIPTKFNRRWIASRRASISFDPVPSNTPRLIGVAFKHCNSRMDVQAKRQITVSIF